MYQSMVNIQSPTAEIRRGKKEEERRNRMKILWSALLHRATIISCISPIRPEAPRGRTCTKFGTAAGVTDVITRDKIVGDRLRGVDSVRGRKLPFPIH